MLKAWSKTILVRPELSLILVFDQVLQVKAVDGDREINSDIEYSITGGPQHIFGINKSTGTLYSKV